MARGGHARRTLRWCSTGEVRVRIRRAHLDDRDFGLHLSRKINRLAAADGFATDLPARALLQQGLEATPDDIVIVGQ